VSNAGDYACVVTGDCGTVTSNIASVNVTPATVISQQPTSVDVCEGSDVTFSVQASGSNISYQWQFNGNDIAGATNPTYTINNVSSSNAGDYVCVVTGDCGTVTSDVASLSTGSGVTINTQPVSGDYCEGSDVTLNISADGSNLTYQWQLNGSDIQGATSQSYTINNLNSNNTGDYTCVITSSCGTLTSNAAQIGLLNSVNITQQPQSQELCENSTFTVSVVADGSNLTYQWQFNGNDIQGANSSSYTATLTNNTQGNYTCVINSDCGNLTTDAANIIIDYPTITQQPQSVDKCESDDVIFTITSDGNNDSYQWKFNGNVISGATQAYLVINNVDANDAGDYSCEVSNSCNTSVSSDVATLTINNAPVVTSQPVDLTANVGDNVSFSVSATGTNLTYQWNKNGLALNNGGNISGVNTNTLTINNVTEGDYGNYDCDISGDCGNTSSNIAVLTVITSVDMLEKYGIVISPNPSNGAFTVKLNNSVAPLDVRVIDVNGKIIYNNHFENSQTNTIDLSSHSKGIYFIELEFDEQVVKAKLIFK